jgi:Mn2+/Fe2+ NRAMP family transporter
MVSASSHWVSFVFPFCHFERRQVHRNALATVVGTRAARVLFGVGVLGASMVAAMVCSLSLA